MRRRIWHTLYRMNGWRSGHGPLLPFTRRESSGLLAPGMLNQRDAAFAGLSQLRNRTGRLTSRISDWTPNLWRTTSDLESAVTVGRVHFMVVQIAACGCWAASCSSLLRWTDVLCNHDRNFVHFP
jgi:hypothetical protein